MIVDFCCVGRIISIVKNLYVIITFHFDGVKLVLGECGYLYDFILFTKQKNGCEDGCEGSN